MTKRFVILICCLLIHVTTCIAAPKVAVTIKPLHALVSQIMLGVEKPTLLLPDNASPHTFQLKPSTLKALKDAELIIWVGPELELFMQKSLSTLNPKDGIITALEIPKLHLLKQRNNRQWQSHHEHDHYSHHSNEYQSTPHHAHQADHTNQYQLTHQHDHQDDEHFEDENQYKLNHNPGEQLDPHFWLSIDNAIIFVEYVTQYLISKDNINAKKYQTNAQQLKADLENLKETIARQLKAVNEKPFLVYHDGYQYFENEFDLNAVGTLLLNPHLPLSAKALFDVKQLIKTQGVKCVFNETEFNDTKIAGLLKDMNVTLKELDPLGARIKSNEDSYQKIMQGLADTMESCLK